MEQTSDIIFDSINPKCGERVKELLRENRKTQKWLADQLDITEVHLSNIIRGKKRLTEKKARVIAELFRPTRIEYLLGYDDFKTEKALIKEKQRDDFLMNANEILTDDYRRGVLSQLAILNGYYFTPDIAENIEPDKLDNSVACNNEKIQVGTLIPEYIIERFEEKSPYTLTRFVGQSSVVAVLSANEVQNLADEIVAYAKFKFDLLERAENGGEI